ncbi:cytochrome-c peroxidase [Proteobacteria bacterium 005FR1]|nr:cytochrome-c peroxidase [Proteobacteria bacterium 005FR1]
MATEQRLTGNPAAGRNLPAIEDPVPQLGMKLFFSKALGGLTDSACVTCHHPLLGGGDDLPLPVGVEAEDPDFLGPGRLHSVAGHHFDGGPTVPRNAPTTFNIALWDKVLFHDGRVEVLDGVDSHNGEAAPIRTPDSAGNVSDPADPDALNLTQAQSLFPVTSAEEMRGQFMAGSSNEELRQALVARLTSQALPNTWLAEFQSALNSNESAAELITFETISFALAEYERSQVFVDTPWKDFLEGDDEAITLQAKRGALLFFTAPAAGGAGCSGCHSGDFFTDEKFHVVAIPQIGRGKGDGTDGDDDFGREQTTKRPEDRYAFRTPTLLNVTETGPYGHSGAYKSLREVIVHHLNPAAAIDSFDFTLSNLDPAIQKTNAERNTRLALAQLEHNRSAGSSKLANVALSSGEIDQLEAFLQTLTDSCVADDSCLAQWVPGGPDPDGLRLLPSNQF